jgi:sugar lactone lactonase YvrE
MTRLPCATLVGMRRFVVVALVGLVACGRVTSEATDDAATMAGDTSHLAVDARGGHDSRDTSHDDSHSGTRDDSTTTNIDSLPPSPTDSSPTPTDTSGLPKELFWAEIGRGTLHAAAIDGTAPHVIVSTALFPDGLAIDRTARRIYWVENGTDSVFSAFYDGSSITTLHTNPDAFSNPRAIAVDHEHDLMFWSEGFGIQRAALDGTAVIAVVTGGFPTGVALDVAGSKVYWGDNATDSIRRANYDGSGGEVLYTSTDERSNPNGVAVDVAAGLVFWTEVGAVRAANLDGSAVRTVATAMFPTAVAVQPSLRLLYWTDNGTDSVERVRYDGAARELLYHSTDDRSNAAGIAIALE